MSKPIKDLMTSQLQKRFSGIESACVVNISRLDAITTNVMRGALKKQHIQMHVVKNSLARRALDGGPLGPLAGALQGPSAVVYGDTGIVDIARELVKWAKQHKTIELKQGIIEGDPDLCTVEELSRMKGKRELVGEIGMLITSPGRRLAGCLGSPAAKIAGCLKAKIDQASESSN